MHKHWFHILCALVLAFAVTCLIYGRGHSYNTTIQECRVLVTTVAAKAALEIGAIVVVIAHEHFDGMRIMNNHFVQWIHTVAFAASILVGLYRVGQIVYWLVIRMPSYATPARIALLQKLKSWVPTARPVYALAAMAGMACFLAIPAATGHFALPFALT